LKKRNIVAATVAAAGILTSMGGAIAAAATPPNVVGQDYSDASGTLTGAGFTPIVSTTFGDRKARGDCVVVNQVEQTVQPPENSGGSATNDVLVSLNCEAGVASATMPGNSLASPAGRKAAADAAAAAASASATASPEPAPAG